MLTSRIDIIRTPNKEVATKLANQAIENIFTWSDILDYLDWHVVNELQSTENISDDIPANVIKTIRDKVANLLVQKWEFRKRYDICQKAMATAKDEILNNHAGIQFSESQITFGLAEFLKPYLKG